MNVRRAVAADHEIARAIVDEYADQIGVIVRDDDAAFDLYFAPRAGIWLAQDERGVAGCVALRPLKSAAADAAEVKRLYVRSARRRSGIASALMDALERAAFADGYSTLYLDSHDGLAAALQFYRARGYTPVPRYNDNAQATVFLALSLAPSQPDALDDEDVRPAL